MAKRRPRVKRQVRKKPCFFCTEKKTPDFDDPEILRKFITERGKILGRSKTNLCSKHQRRLTISIKRARHLALLPFVAGIR